MIVMWKKTAALVVAALAGTSLLSGCGAGSPGDDGRPQVVAAFYPLEYVASRIAGDDADVELLTRPGAEPHDLELTFAQTVDLTEADVVVVDTGLQPAVDDAVAQADPAHLVDASDVADRDGDPHFWLDPTRLAAVAGRVADQLSTVDPGRSSTYADRLAVLRSDLKRLDTTTRRGLADCDRDTVVVSHDAFGYYGARYGLDLVSINGLSPDSEPSPAHLRELAALIDARGITTVFSETLASPELADTLAGELGLSTAVLDPIEGLSDQTADEDYLSLMAENLAALRIANGCR